MDGGSDVGLSMPAAVADDLRTKLASLRRSSSSVTEHAQWIWQHERYVRDILSLIVNVRTLACARHAHS